MADKNSKNPESPTCRKCGGTDIDFEYTEMMHGRRINERNALRSACYYLGELLGTEATSDSGFDANIVSNIGITIVELAAMVAIRDSATDDKNVAEVRS